VMAHGSHYRSPQNYPHFDASSLDPGICKFSETVGALPRGGAAPLPLLAVKKRSPSVLCALGRTLTSGPVGCRALWSRRLVMMKRAKQSKLVCPIAIIKGLRLIMKANLFHRLSLNRIDGFCIYSSWLWPVSAHVLNKYHFSVLKMA
jgi:hypothetical protein